MKKKLNNKPLIMEIVTLTNTLDDVNIDSALRTLLEETMKSKIKELVDNNYHVWYQESRGYYLAKPKQMDANGKRLQVKAKTEEDLYQKIYEKLAHKELEILDSLFKRMIKYRTSKKVDPISPKTASEYTRIWNNYYQEVAKKKLTSISGPEWVKFFKKMVHDNGFTKKRFMDIYAVASAIMKFAMTDDIIYLNPIRDIPTRDDMDFARTSAYNTVKAKSFSEEQEKKVIEWCVNRINNNKRAMPIYPLLLLFQLFMGMRVGECRGLTWNDINYNERTVYISKQTVNGIQFDVETLTTTYEGESEVDHVKGHEEARVLPLSDEAIEVLRRIKELELDETKIFPVRYNTYNDTVKLAADYAGADPKQFHTHCLRATRLTDLYNSSSDLVVTQMLAGHTTSDMTRKYVKNHEAVAKMTELMREKSYATSAEPLFEPKNKSRDSRER